MARTGPVTKDTSTVALGLAQVRVGASAANIGSVTPVLTSSNSIGALANTKFVGETNWFNLESGFPLLEDYAIVTREKARFECGFKEITPFNMAVAYGFDISAAPYSSYTAHSGEVKLGVRTAPEYVRMEAVYTYPNGSNHLYVIAPRAQVTSSVEVSFAAEDVAAVPVAFEFKNASSEVSGGNMAWDTRPLGRLFWD
jgi:hypothetical protein